MTKDKVINALKKHKYRYDAKGIVIFAKKKNINIVCSFLGSNTTISVSFDNSTANLEKATKVIQTVFGYSFEHLQDNPLDNVNANYFSFKRVN